MSVATLVPAAVIYREEQNFDWWVYAVLAVRGYQAWREDERGRVAVAT